MPDEKGKYCIQEYEEMEKTEEYGLPEEFIKKMERLLGSEAEEFFSSYGEERKYGLRLNPVKTGMKMPENLENSQKIPWTEEGYYYEDSLKPGKHPFHEAGVYYIQEPSAMAAAETFCPQPGEILLDLCAAPGGKTTHIAGKMKGKGLLVTNEIHPARARILSQNVERMGISNAVVLNEAPEKLAPLFQDFFDGILVDAPCSGEGMFRKDPDARKEWSPAHVELCASRQDKILDCAAAMVKPGGRIVYSTCTFSPEENEGSVARFLKRHPEFSVKRPDCIRWFEEGRPEWADGTPELKDTVRIWPHKTGGEGHFMAVLARRQDPHGKDARDMESGGKKRGGRNEKGKTEQPGIREFREFCSSTLTEQGRKKLDEPGYRFLSFGENLYRIPEVMPVMDGLRILRPGLHLGTVKKGRMEPSHALALYLSPEDVVRKAETGSGDMTARYLNGESLPAPDPAMKGWTLITTGGWSLGWAKASAGVLKNHYPKGLRIPLTNSGKSEAMSSGSGASNSSSSPVKGCSNRRKTE